MWKMTSKAICDFAPLPLSTDFRWTKQHSVRTSVLATTQKGQCQEGLQWHWQWLNSQTKNLVSIKVLKNYNFTMKPHYFIEISQALTKQSIQRKRCIWKFLPKVMSETFAQRSSCTSFFVGLRAVDQPLPCIALFSVLCKITRNYILIAERLSEVGY